MKSFLFSNAVIDVYNWIVVLSLRGEYSDVGRPTVYATSYQP